MPEQTALVRVSDEEADAFAAWVECGRKVKPTAEATGLSERTIRDWVRRYGWPERWREMRVTVAEDAIVEARTELRLSLTSAYHSAVSIANDPEVSPSIRLQAIELVHKLSLGAEANDKAGQPLTLIDARQVLVQPNDLSPRALRDAATKVIEGNVEANRVKRQGRTTFNG